MARTKKSLKTTKLRDSQYNKRLSLLVGSAFALIGAIIIMSSSAAPSSPTASFNFTPSDGTWPTSVLNDPMSLAMGRYNKSYNYPGSSSYGPILNYSGSVSGLKSGGWVGQTDVRCAQTEPVGQWTFDSNKNTWYLDSGKADIWLLVTDLVNGSNTGQLNIESAKTATIDKTKPMNCVAQVVLTKTKYRGAVVPVLVPVTQRFTLQPK